MKDYRRPLEQLTELGPVRKLVAVADTRDVSPGKDARSANMQAYWRD